MLGYVVIVLVLPAIALADTPPRSSNTKQVCNDTEARKAGDVFFDTFSQAVKYSLANEKNDNSFMALPGIMYKYANTANASCYKDTTGLPRNELQFYKLLTFSVERGAFKGFVENDGVACINAVKENIAQCVREQVGEIDDKHHTLWQMTSAINQNCEGGGKVKRCTLTVIRNEGYNKCKYGGDVMVYVESLFDFMLKQCKPIMAPEDEEKTQSEEAGNDGVVTNVLLGIVMALSLITLGYVIVRDCSAGSGRKFKSFKEQFAMGQRRRSLVHNEVCHEN